MYVSYQANLKLRQLKDLRLVEAAGVEPASEIARYEKNYVCIQFLVIQRLPKKLARATAA